MATTVNDETAISHARRDDATARAQPHLKYQPERDADRIAHSRGLQRDDNATRNLIADVSQCSGCPAREQSASVLFCRQNRCHFFYPPYLLDYAEPVKQNARADKGDSRTRGPVRR